ncbi:MAG: putative replicase protein [Alehxovirus pratenecus]|uniref:RNA-directed RNA polymerase n=1 Tax=Leviviridae sp. TaxID=2027243 RepID=A0ABY3SS55_9VIRU|nr:MAG: putative replicase protein [Leviviridae sp.]
MIQNSGDDFFLGLYSAMFFDIVSRRPSLHVDCERDYKRLLSIVKDHGCHRVFCDFLPALGKHLDQCLANELFVRSGLPLSRPFKHGSPIPRLFKGLYLALFDESGVLRSNLDSKHVADLRQVLYCLKRFRVTCDPSYTFRSVDEYVQIDAEIRKPSLSWDCDLMDTRECGSLSLRDCHSQSPQPGDLFYEVDKPASPSISDKCLDTIQFVADAVTAELGRFKPYEWGARHGPGAVADAKGGADKYLFPTWPRKLDNIFPYADWAFSSNRIWADVVIHEPDSLSSENESDAKLITVPKEFTKPRLIASEPTAHQWCQQVLRDFLMERVSKTSISSSVRFNDQSRNARLALLASHTGSHSTIDLSSASDRLSCWLVERLFRRSPSVLEGFHAVRTRYLRNNIDKKLPSLIKLRKFSTMGSALTFPVQTYVFTMVAVGVLLHCRGLPLTYASIRTASRAVRVFGDDIIVPNDVSDAVQECLHAFGLKVNRNKTFRTGKFRESCGCEAYDGNDVTRVSVNAIPAVSSPESVIGTVDTHNNFYSRGWWRTADFLKRKVTAMKNYSFKAVAPDSGSVGWYDVAWRDSPHLKKRWNPSLQRIEYRVTRLYSRASTVPTRGESMLLQYFTVGCRPTKFLVRELGKLASISRPQLRTGWESEWG